MKFKIGKKVIATLPALLFEPRPLKLSYHQKMLEKCGIMNPCSGGMVAVGKSTPKIYKLVPSWFNLHVDYGRFTKRHEQRDVNKFSRSNERSNAAFLEPEVYMSSCFSIQVEVTTSVCQLKSPHF